MRHVNVHPKYFGRGLQTYSRIYGSSKYVRRALIIIIFSIITWRYFNDVIIVKILRQIRRWWALGSSLKAEFDDLLKEHLKSYWTNARIRWIITVRWLKWMMKCGRGCVSSLTEWLKKASVIHHNVVNNAYNIFSSTHYITCVHWWWSWERYLCCGFDGCFHIWYWRSVACWSPLCSGELQKRRNYSQNDYRW